MILKVALLEDKWNETEGEFSGRIINSIRPEIVWVLDFGLKMKQGSAPFQKRKESFSSKL